MRPYRQQASASKLTLAGLAAWFLLACWSCDRGRREGNEEIPPDLGRSQGFLRIPLDGWMRETYDGGKGVTEVSHPRRGLMSVAVSLHPRHPNRIQGEVFFELESLPHVTGPVDFTGATLTARVGVPLDLVSRDAPNGLQLFVETENGDGKIARQYGPWENIEGSGSELRFVPTMFPGSGLYSDPALDIERVVAVGLKVGLNSRALYAVEGRIGVSEVTVRWPEAGALAELKQRVRLEQPYLADERARFGALAPRGGLPPEPPPRGRGRALGVDEGLRPLAQVERVEALDTAYGGLGVWVADMRFEGYVDSGAGRSARVEYRLAEPLDVRAIQLAAAFAVDENLRGVLSRPNRVYLELVDGDGHVMRGPWTNASPRAYQWQELELVPTVDVPMPLGSVQPGFDLRRVEAVRLRFELGRFSDQLLKLRYGRPFPVAGKWYISALHLEPSAHRVESFIKPELPPCAAEPQPVDRGVFLIGVNYAWIHYGWDVGQNPYGGRESCGFSSHGLRLERDFAELKKNKVDLIRFFVLGDLRTGVVFDAAGLAHGLGRCVGEDLEAFVATAKRHGLRVMPTLVDFLSADGVELRRLGPQPRMEWREGEHPEVLVNPEARGRFLDAVIRPLARELGRLQRLHGNLHSIDLANEIDNAKAVVHPDLFAEVKAFIRGAADVVRSEAPGIPVTLGTRDRSDLVRYWQDLEVDVRQFHFYDDFAEEGLALDYPVGCLGFSQPVLLGEVDPTGDLGAKIDTVYRNGYAGVLFWSLHERDGFRIDLGAIAGWRR